MKLHTRVLLFSLFVIAASACAGPAATPAASAAPTWQTYTNSDAGFSIQFPANWNVETLPDQNAGLMHGTSLQGPEGSVELRWGTGFGGACPEGFQNIQVAQGAMQACYTKAADGTEHWENISKNLANTSFSARAFTSDATASSHDLILKVLATLRFS